MDFIPLFMGGGLCEGRGGGGRGREEEGGGGGRAGERIYGNVLKKRREGRLSG